MLKLRISYDRSHLSERTTWNPGDSLNAIHLPNNIQTRSDDTDEVLHLLQEQRIKKKNRNKKEIAPFVCRLRSYDQ